MKTYDIVKKVKSIIRDNLMDCVDKYGCDLHHELFNTSASYIYSNEARKALNQVDVFRAIGIVADYVNENFGETYAEIEPCSIANMLVYIEGKELLGKSKTLDEKWGEKLTKSDLLKIRKELNAFIRENPYYDLLSAWR